jgi:hypothetical protein
MATFAEALLLRQKNASLNQVRINAHPTKNAPILVGSPFMATFAKAQLPRQNDA